MTSQWQVSTDNDATAVTFFAIDKLGAIPLFVLDWDIVQIEGAVLETWLPQVFRTLEDFARLLPGPQWLSRRLHRG